jgi:hypothetical protein
MLVAILLSLLLSDLTGKLQVIIDNKAAHRQILALCHAEC